ncbi:MAG: hypothetical protein K0M67_10925 [Thiobacillus sp.]|jgi:hypothetical protein|uniref:hypothetical protein n=1 Tax=Hydrogenophaga sp. TaxID=1904254 RepID=UPI0025BA5085|nr:hypothetical protein [Hydrogenophaga sp.]MBU4322846.1 hypothetical protein [Gammaproteobacteria bacterium]MBU4508720.1 hypothetical protein [Gammaproteobacteria bacterium]MBW8468765.1 hypothetical protein [Thiobacillus sp.]MCG2656317.1 hypothetical protein [Hydrogenophaga sp.]
MNTPTDNTPQPEPRPRKRPRGGGGENASGKGAQNARELAHWNHSRVPSASELLAIGELFQGMTPHRMKLHQLALLREHVLAYRIRCGHPEIDAFMDAIFLIDFNLECYFKVHDARAGRYLHPLSRSSGKVTPFELSTQLAWQCSVAPDVLLDEAPVMHAAGFFYASGHFWCAHPVEVAKRGTPRVLLHEVRQARRRMLRADLDFLARQAPQEGRLLRALLLGATAGDGVDGEQFARLLTVLHLWSERITYPWGTQVIDLKN